MLSVEPFQPAHLVAIVMQRNQLPELAALPGRIGEAAALGPAFTAFAAEKAGARRVVACAGLAENRADYASAWAMFAEGNGLATWGGLIRVIHGVFEASGYARIDTMVRDDFAAGHAFARRIGFVQCGLFHRYGEDGSDFAIYERVR